MGMSSGYFSADNRGGVIAASIEHQDVVAAFVALDLLNGFGVFEGISHRDSDWVISLESLDDIIVSINAMRYYVQVKNQQITPGVLQSVAAHFEKRLAETKPTREHSVRFVLCAIGGMSSRITELPKKLVELKNSERILSSAEFAEAVSDLSGQYYLPPSVVENLTIDTGHFLRDDRTTFAMFAHCIRRLHPIDDIGDFTIELIYRELLNEIIAPRRKQRGKFSKRDLLLLMNRLSLPKENSVTVGLKRIATGYTMKLGENPNQEIKMRGTQRLMKAWRKAYFPTVLKRQFLIPCRQPGGYGDCGDCGHPLIGGFFGLNGLQCPDCGFMPCLTLVSFCSCGHYNIIKRQPPTDQLALDECVANYILHGDRRCNVCGQELPVGVIAHRCVIVPVPLPPEEYLNLGLHVYLARYHSDS